MKTETPPTKPLSKKQSRQLVLLQLKLLFPNTFDLENRKPLKKGILEDILEHPNIKAAGFTKLMIRQALKWYVGGYVYLRAFEASDAYRIDLAGQKVAKVTDEERAYAKAKLGLLRNRAKSFLQIQKKGQKRPEKVPPYKDQNIIQ